MGVPKFYRWISERYPCLSQVVKDYQVRNIQHWLPCQPSVILVKLEYFERCSLRPNLKGVMVTLRYCFGGELVSTCSYSQKESRCICIVWLYRTWDLYVGPQTHTFNW